jgi:hypothetical protein
MKKRFETKMIYRVWNDTRGSEIYFTSEVEAERYKKICVSFGELIYLSVWSWEVKIEE